MKQDVETMVLSDLITLMKKEKLKKYQPETKVEKKEEEKPTKSGLLIRLARLG